MAVALSLDGTYGLATHGVALNKGHSLLIAQTGVGLSSINVTAVAAASDGVTLSFDQPVNGTGVAETGSGSGWNPTGSTTQPDATSVKVGIADVSSPPPNVTAVDASSGTQIDVTFDNDFGTGVVTPTAPPGGTGWNTNGDTSKPASNKLRIPLVDVAPAIPALLAIDGFTNYPYIDLVFSADISGAGITPTPPPSDATWTLPGFETTQPASNKIRFQVSNVTPLVMSAVKSADGVDLTFNHIVSASGSFLGSKDVTGSGNAGWDSATIEDTDPAGKVIRIHISDVAPTLLSADVTVDLAAIDFTFNAPVDRNGIGPGGETPVGWFPDSLTQPSANVLRLFVNDAPPVITRVEVDVQGVTIESDFPITVGSCTMTEDSGLGFKVNEFSPGLADLVQLTDTRWRIPVADVPPTLQTIGVGGGGISLQFDTDITLGTPDKTGNGVGWDLGLVYKTGLGSLAMIVNDVPPNIDAIVTSLDGIELDFSLDIGTVAAPTNGAPPAVQITEVTKPDGKTLVLAAVAPVPKVVEVMSDVAGINVGFDAKVDITPGLKPIVAKPPAANVTALSHPGDETVRLVIQPPPPYAPHDPHAKFDNVPNPPEGGKAASTNPPPSRPVGSAKPE